MIRKLMFFIVGLLVLLLPAIAVLWFVPGRSRTMRRVIGLTCLAIFFAAYFSKSPYPQTFVPLHEKVPEVIFDGDRVTITDFRDAIHPVGASAQPRWVQKSFDLNALTGAQFILQPFGDSLATVHVMTSFAFENGDHLAVSFEARRTSWDKFDPIAGFFRHELFILDITPPTGEIRDYLRKLLVFSGSLQEKPQYTELVARQKLRPGVKPPWDFESPDQWSAHLRPLFGARN